MSLPNANLAVTLTSTPEVAVPANASITTSIPAVSRSTTLADTIGFTAVNSVEKLEAIDRVAPIIEDSSKQLPPIIPTEQVRRNKYGNLKSGSSALLNRKINQRTISHFDSADYYRQKFTVSKDTQNDNNSNGLHSGLSSEPKIPNVHLNEGPKTSVSSLSTEEHKENEPSTMPIPQNPLHVSSGLNHSSHYNSLPIPSRSPINRAALYSHSTNTLHHNIASTSLSANSLSKRSSMHEAVSGDSSSSSSEDEDNNNNNHKNTNITSSTSSAAVITAPVPVPVPVPVPAPIHTPTSTDSKLDSNTVEPYAPLPRSLASVRSRYSRTSASYTDSHGNTVSRLSSASIENFGADEDEALEEYNRTHPES